MVTYPPGIRGVRFIVASRDQRKYAEWKDKAGRYWLTYEMSPREKVTAGFLIVAGPASPETCKFSNRFCQLVRKYFSLTESTQGTLSVLTFETSA